MKKLVIILTVLLLISNFMICYSAEFPDEIPELRGEAVIAIDAKSKDILFQLNQHQQMYPASTTKMMTAILVLENCQLSDQVSVSFSSANTEGSSIYLQPGETFTVEQLLYALLLESANDVAEALARHVAGSISEFSLLMTNRAKELGALNTNFVNPHGLPHQKHYTTAYDLAQIALHAIEIPKLIEISSTSRYQIPPTRLYPEVRYLKNSNRFLWGTGSGNKFEYLGEEIDIMYPTIHGIKTGYTKVAGNCLVSFAEKDGRQIISVVLRSSGNQLYRDSRYLIDYGLYNFQTTKILAEGEKVIKAPVRQGLTADISLVAKQDVYLTTRLGDELKPLQTVVVSPNLSAPIRKNQAVGEVIYTFNGRVYARAPLVAAERVVRFQVLWLVLPLILLIAAIVRVKKWSLKKYKQFLF